jgi:hypothetical protein
MRNLCLLPGIRSTLWTLCLQLAEHYYAMIHTLFVVLLLQTEISEVQEVQCV